jgi:nucleoside-diphosphate-sugar epimerase
MKVFLTGATGFIGAYVLRELLSQGHELTCLKRITSDLSHLGTDASKVTWVNVSEDWQTIFRHFHPEAVINLAWDGVSSADRVIWQKQVPNINFQQELLNLSAECAVRKFIGIGSQSEYGDFEGVIDENFPVNPKTAYAASKLACQDLLKCFCEINHIEWYWFREFPLFGPGESDRWLIPSLIKAMCTKDSMDLTPGEQLLPYLYVGECAKAIVSPLQTDDKSGIYNVCADNPRPLKELVTMIKDKVNPAFRLNFGALPYRFGQSMFMGSHTEKLAQNLYTLDTTSFETHLQETIHHYVNLYTK